MLPATSPTAAPAGTPQKYVGDGEDSADGSDSDFGLSDRQLEELWTRFQQGNEDVLGVEEEIEKNLRLMEMRLDEGDEDTSEHKDSDFGLSDWQLYQLTKRAPAQSEALSQDLSPGSTDPLRCFAQEKAMAQSSSHTPPSTPSPLRKSLTSEGSGRLATPQVTPQRLSKGLSEVSATSSSAKLSPEEILEGQLPQRDLVRLQRLHNAPWRLQSVLLSSREIDRVTWYLFRLEENDETRFYMKRFSDFTHLDKCLRANLRPGRRIPELPPSGRFGIRHFLDLGDFNKKRLEGLRLYVEDLLSQVGSLSNEPSLMRFFGRGAPGRVLPPGAVRQREDPLTPSS